MEVHWPFTPLGYVVDDANGTQQSASSLVTPCSVISVGMQLLPTNTALPFEKKWKEKKRKETKNRKLFSGIDRSCPTTKTGAKHGHAWTYGKVQVTLLLIFLSLLWKWGSESPAGGRRVCVELLPITQISSVQTVFFLFLLYLFVLCVCVCVCVVRYFFVVLGLLFCFVFSNIVFINSLHGGFTPEFL